MPREFSNLFNSKIQGIIFPTKLNFPPNKNSTVKCERWRSNSLLLTTTQFYIYCHQYTIDVQCFTLAGTQQNPFHCFLFCFLYCNIRENKYWLLSILFHCVPKNKLHFYPFSCFNVQVVVRLLYLRKRVPL